MDKKWKAAERGVPAALNEIFSELGLSPIERIPVNGRTGPDLTWNELGLVINVKDRKSNPLYMKFANPTEQTTIRRFGNLIGFRIKDLKYVLQENPPIYLFTLRQSKIVTDYWEHMDEWRREFFSPGVSAIVLHYYRQDYTQSTMLIHTIDLERLRTAYKGATKWETTS